MSAQKPWTWGRLVDHDGTPIRGETAVAYVTTCVRAGGDSDFYTVLTIAADGLPADVCHTGNGPHSQANARLIAAAPELLTMLKRVADGVSLLDWTGAGCCPFCDIASGPQPPCQLTAAIAKAEGR